MTEDDIDPLLEGLMDAGFRQVSHGVSRSFGEEGWTFERDSHRVRVVRDRLRAVDASMSVGAGRWYHPNFVVRVLSGLEETPPAQTPEQWIAALLEAVSLVPDGFTDEIRSDLHKTVREEFARKLEARRNGQA